MKAFCFILLISLSTISYAQVYPVDFEASGNGANWTWTVFENETNPPLEIVSNPDTSGINTSSTVAKFTALDGGAPFAGCETMHGADVGTFTLTPDNAYVAMMVYKSVISDVGFKFATPEGASTGEIKVPNTVINQWERLVFDFSGVIDEPSSVGIDQIIVFPDFQDRNSDNIIYFDNIIFGDSSLLSIGDIQTNELTIAPVPATEAINFKGNQPIENLVVYDVIGNRVLEMQPNSREFSIDVTSIPSGLYYVRLVIGEQQLVKKFVVN